MIPAGLLVRRFEFRTEKHVIPPIEKTRANLSERFVKVIPKSILLVTKSLNRAHRGSAEGGVDPENDADQN